MERDEECKLKNVCTEDSQSPGVSVVTKDCYFNQLPEELLLPILLLAAPDDLGKSSVRCVCRKWASAVLHFVHYKYFSYAETLECAAKKLPELQRVALAEPLCVLDVGGSLAQMGKLSSLEFCISQPHMQLRSMAASPLASQLSELKLVTRHDFDIAELARLTSLERIELREWPPRNPRHHREGVAHQLQTLTGLPGLTQLRLELCRESSVLGLAALTALRDFHFSAARRDGEERLAGLSCLGDLRRLFFDGRGRELGFLVELTQLESLTLEWLAPRWGPMGGANNPWGPDGDNVHEFPDCRHVSSLTKLDLRKYTGGGTLRANGLNLNALRIFKCNFAGLVDFDVGGLAPSLESLMLASTPVGSLHLQGAQKLREVGIWDAALDELEGLQRLTALERLVVANLKGFLTALHGLEHATRLHTLNLEDCFGLAALPGLGALTSLTRLQLLALPELASVPSLAGLRSLKVLHVSGCCLLEALPDLGVLSSLRELRVEKMSWAVLDRELVQLMGLEALWLVRLEGMTSLAFLGDFASLTQLCLKPSEALDWPPLGRMASLQDLRLIKTLRLEDCPAEQFGLLPELRHFRWSMYWWDCGETADVQQLLRLVAAMRHLTRLTLAIPCRPWKGELDHLEREPSPPAEDVYSLGHHLLAAIGEAGGELWRESSFEPEQREDSDPYGRLTSNIGINDDGEYTDALQIIM